MKYRSSQFLEMWSQSTFKLPARCSALSHIWNERQVLDTKWRRSIAAGISDFILLMKVTVAALSKCRMICFPASSSAHVSTTVTIAKSSSNAMLGLKSLLKRSVSLQSSWRHCKLKVQPIPKFFPPAVSAYKLMSSSLKIFNLARNGMLLTLSSALSLKKECGTSKSLQTSCDTQQW